MDKNRSSVKLDSGRVLLVNQAELLYLAQMLGARHLVGLEMAVGPVAPAVEQSQGEILAALKQRGWLDDGGALDALLMPVFQAVCLPERALVVVRDIPQIGKQVLIFLQRKGQIVLHTFPQAGQHRLAALSELDQVQQMLSEWFPLHRYSNSDAEFLMASKLFDDFRRLAEKQQVQDAVNMLDAVDGDEKAKSDLASAIMNRTMSGSLAAFRVRGEHMVDAQTFAILTGPETAWMITQPAHDSSILHVCRVGQDFVAILQQFVQRLGK